MTIRRVGRALGLLILSGPLIWLLTFAAVLVLSWAWSDRDARAERADAIFCLGAGMSIDDPMLPGPASDQRAIACAELHAAGVADVVVFTGRGNATNSAAQAMATRAIVAGLPPDAALVEPNARSTIQNAAFGLAMLPDEVEDVVLVSNAFHLPRSWAIFRALGVAEVSVHAAAPLDDAPDDPRYQTVLDWQIREASAIWLNVLRGIAYAAGGAVGIDRETRISWFN
ncbi:YdcF family protein [Gymnodinialimonas sp. 2305UL16-5]|uniref:YdcF family protein n=1 Tax=Gymnodinialimonas mytili TaxID=3126503 RepID=UPI00309B3C91